MPKEVADIALLASVSLASVRSIVAEGLYMRANRNLLLIAFLVGCGGGGGGTDAGPGADTGPRPDTGPNVGTDSGPVVQEDNESFATADPITVGTRMTPMRVDG